MSWRDDVAVRVITKDMRMKLLGIHISKEADALVKFLLSKRHLTQTESEVVLAGITNGTRMKRIIERLVCRMTTEVFMDFVDAIGDSNMCNAPDLKDAILHKYNSNLPDVVPSSDITRHV